MAMNDTKSSSWPKFLHDFMTFGSFFLLKMDHRPPKSATWINQMFITGCDLLQNTSEAQFTGCITTFCFVQKSNKMMKWVYISIIFGHSQNLDIRMTNDNEFKVQSHIMHNSESLGAWPHFVPSKSLIKSWNENKYLQNVVMDKCKQKLVQRVISIQKWNQI
jgi:hypothetical protein